MKRNAWAPVEGGGGGARDPWAATPRGGKRGLGAWDAGTPGGDWGGLDDNPDDDNWVGAILFAAVGLVGLIGGSLWGLAGGPARPYEWFGGALGFIAALLSLSSATLAALRKGEDPGLSRSALGFALFALGGLLGGWLGWSRIGGALAGAGIVIIGRRAQLALRRLFELEPERYGGSRTILLGVVAVYFGLAGAAPVGTLHLAAILVLVWRVIPALMERTVRLRDGIRGLFRKAEPEPEVYIAPDPYERFLPQHRGVIRLMSRFISENFEKQGWYSPQVTEVFESPAFTTYILEVPTNIKVDTVISRDTDLARAIRVEEDAVAILQGARFGGVLVQVRKRPEQRTKLWFDDIIARGTPGIAERTMAAVVGADERGEPVTIDLDDATAPHLLVIGQSGSGKSYLMHVMLVQLLARNSPIDLQLAIIDPKGTFGMRYDHVPHLFAPVIKGTDGAIELMRAVRDEIERRRLLFEEAGTSSIKDYRRQTGKRLPTFLFVMDEAADLGNAEDKALAEAYAQYVREIALKGRAFGVFLLIGVQRPTVENVGKFRDNLTKRIVLLLTSPRESAMAFGEEKGDSSATKLGGRGDGFLMVPAGRQRFAGAYLPDEYDEEAVRLGKGDLNVRNVIEGIIAHRGGPKDWSTAPDPTKVGAAAAASIGGGADPGAVALERIGAEHNDLCTDREWLIVAGARLAVGASDDAYAVTTFSPEALESFVRRAAEERGYVGDPFRADEIQRTLGRMFPERDGSPQRSRQWSLNRAIVEGSLLERFGAASGETSASGDKAPTGGPDERVARIRERDRRGL